MKGHITDQEIRELIVSRDLTITDVIRTYIEFKQLSYTNIIILREEILDYIYNFNVNKYLKTIL
jgi:hypothetical protein